MWKHNKGYSQHGWTVGQRVIIIKSGSEKGITGYIAAINDSDGKDADTVTTVVCPDKETHAGLWWDNSKDEQGYGPAPRILNSYTYGEEMRRVAIDVDGNGNLV